jgi:predicted transcriptional regulator
MVWKRPRKIAKKKFVIDKTKACIAHTKKRAWKRYHVNLNNKDINEIVEMIQNGNTIHLMKESNSRSHHLVKYKGEDMIFVYDKMRQIPVTCLAKETYEEINQKKL